MSNQPVFLIPWRLEKPYFSPSFISPQTQRPTLTISIAFGGGVIAGEINLDSLSAITNNAKIKSSGFAAVLDKNKTCIAYPDQTKVNQQIKLNLNQPDGFSKESQKIQIEGKSFFVNMAVVPLSGWITVVFQPVDEAFETLKWIQRVFWFAGIGAFCITLVLIFFIVRKLYHPFADLNAEMGKISKGDYDISPSISIYNEFNRLAEGLRTMSREIKDREIALKESGNRFRELFNHMSDGVAIYDAVDNGNDFVFKEINQASEQITQINKEALIGKKVSDAFPGVKDMGLFDVLIRVWKTGKPEFHPTSMYTDGRISLWVQNYVYKLPGGEIVAIYNDITEKKQADEKLELYQKDLEVKVAERTSELKATNQELEDFVYSVSHDLRAPLRSISGFAQIIDRRHKASLNDEGQHYFDNIVKASKQMGDLIDDLLKFSRLGRRAIKSEPVPLDDVLKAAVETLSDPIKEAGARINLPGQMPMIQGDLKLATHIFINLLENAVKYHNPNVAPHIDIGFEVKDPYVIISVADNGIGIAPEYHEKIFNIFQRLHNQADYPGTGIGLSAVKKAVQIMGGQVWVGSEPGKGSVFRIEIPMAIPT